MFRVRIECQVVVDIVIMDFRVVVNHVLRGNAWYFVFVLVLIEFALPDALFVVFDMVFIGPDFVFGKPDPEHVVVFEVPDVAGANVAGKSEGRKNASELHRR